MPEAACPLAAQAVIQPPLARPPVGSWLRPEAPTALRAARARGSTQEPPQGLRQAGGKASVLGKPWGKAHRTLPSHPGACDQQRPASQDGQPHCFLTSPSSACGGTSHTRLVNPPNNLVQGRLGLSTDGETEARSRVVARPSAPGGKCSRWALIPTRQ